MCTFAFTHSYTLAVGLVSYSWCGRDLPTRQLQQAAHSERWQWRSSCYKYIGSISRLLHVLSKMMCLRCSIGYHTMYPTLCLAIISGISLSTTALELFVTAQSGWCRFTPCQEDLDCHFSEWATRCSCLVGRSRPCTSTKPTASVQEWVKAKMHSTVTHTMCINGGCCQDLDHTVIMYSHIRRNYVYWCA